MGNQKALTRTVSLVVVAFLLIAISIVSSGPAAASFHLMKIVEVYQGAQADSEFIELQMYSAGQNGVSGKTVKVFAPDGTETGSFTFDRNMSNGSNQAHILLATSAAEAEYAVEADLEITESMQGEGGAACFEDVDCVAWGNYSGDKSKTGNPFSPAEGLPTDKSMTRDTSGGNDPGRLDGGDDTNDSEADFDAAQPTPTANDQSGASPSGSTSPSPTESQTPSGSPTEPHGDPANAKATITRPRSRQTYPAAKLLTFKGTGRHPDDEDFTVTIALKQELKSGRCRWLKPGGTFVRDGCKANDQHMLQVSGSDRWRYKLRGALAPSRDSRKVAGYVLYAQAECSCSPFPARGDKAPFKIR